MPVAVAVPIVGASGTAVANTELDAALGLDVPTEFVAVTVNVQFVFFVRPVTTMDPDAEVDTVPVIPPGDDVAVQLVIAVPPLLAGAV